MLQRCVETTLELWLFLNQTKKKHHLLVFHSHLRCDPFFCKITKSALKTWTKSTHSEPLGWSLGSNPEATSLPIAVAWPMWRYTRPHHTSRHPWLLWSWLIAMPTSVWMIQVLWVAWVRLGDLGWDVSLKKLRERLFLDVLWRRGTHNEHILYIFIIIYMIFWSTSWCTKIHGKLM